VRVLPTSFEAPWWGKLGRSKRSYKRKLEAFHRLLDEMAGDEARNAVALWAVRESVGEQGQVLLLSNRREHCQHLERICRAVGYSSGLLIGAESAAEREEYKRTIARLEARELQAVAGTYQAIGIGFDVPHLGRGVCCTPVANDAKGRMQFRQFRGRLARRNTATEAAGKADAAIYYLLDERVFGLRPLQNLVRWSKRVSVFHGGRWIGGREYLKGASSREEAKREAEDREFEDLFSGNS